VKKWRALRVVLYDSMAALEEDAGETALYAWESCKGSGRLPPVADRAGAEIEERFIAKFGDGADFCRALFLADCLGRRSLQKQESGEQVRLCARPCLLGGDGGGGEACGSAGEDGVVLEAEEAIETLLAHGETDEEAEFDELGLSEVGVEHVPLGVVEIGAPGDGLGETECGFLAIVVASRLFEVEEILDVIFHENGAERFGRALIAAVGAVDGFGNVETAEFLDGVIANTVDEGIAPGVGERPEDGRNVGTNGVAFWARSAFAAGAIEFGEHGRIGDFGDVSVIETK
jgi:hypothetical protein